MNIPTIGSVIKAWGKMPRGQNGAGLVEQVVALALLAVILVVLLQALSTAFLASGEARDRVTMLNLAQTQLEDAKGRPYQSAYPTVTPPEGYSIALPEAMPVGTYTLPDGTPLPDTLQELTVTVTGIKGSTLSISTYKARR